MDSGFDCRDSRLFSLVSNVMQTVYRIDVAASGYRFLCFRFATSINRALASQSTFIRESQFDTTRRGRNEVRVHNSVMLF